MAHTVEREFYRQAKKPVTFSGAIASPEPMCGRYSLDPKGKKIAIDFNCTSELDRPINSRFNIAPTQSVLIVRDALVAGTRRREGAEVKWWLIPSWAKDSKIANSLINARSEGVESKPSFRTALKRRRCLLPATGFYEWAAAPGGVKGPKQPHFFMPTQTDFFGFAGLWESWTSPDDELVETCTILTTTANDVVSPVHLRMPVILQPANFDAWLDPAVEDSSRVTPLLKPLLEELISARKVGLAVNSVKNEGPELILPQ